MSQTDHPTTPLTQQGLLSKEVQHINVTTTHVVPLVEAMAATAFQGRNVGRAAGMYSQKELYAS